MKRADYLRKGSAKPNRQTARIAASAGARGRNKKVHLFEYGTRHPKKIAASLGWTNASA
jgi:hypothetical protein